MWNGTDDERRDLAVYNLVDCLLPWQILVELRTLGTMVEMASCRLAVCVVRD